MKPRFLSSLAVRRTHAGAWQLTAPLVFESAHLDRIVTVPEGFETDFASVPRLPLAYWLFGNVADEAAVVHDFAYSCGLVSRKEADALFSEAMGSLDAQSIEAKSGIAKAVPRAWFSVRRGAMWLGVRLFGGPRYSPAAA